MLKLLWLSACLWVEHTALRALGQRVEESDDARRTGMLSTDRAPRAAHSQAALHPSTQHHWVPTLRPGGALDQNPGPRPLWTLNDERSPEPHEGAQNPGAQSFVADSLVAKGRCDADSHLAPAAAATSKATVSWDDCAWLPLANKPRAALRLALTVEVVKLLNMHRPTGVAPVMLWGSTLVEAANGGAGGLQRKHRLFEWKPDSDLLIPIEIEQELARRGMPMFEQQLENRGILHFMADGCRRFCFSPKAKGITSPGTFGECAPKGKRGSGSVAKFWEVPGTMWIDGYDSHITTKKAVSVRGMGGGWGGGGGRDPCGLVPQHILGPSWSESTVNLSADGDIKTSRLPGSEFEFPVPYESTRVLEALYGQSWPTISGWNNWNNGFCVKVG